MQTVLEIPDDLADEVERDARRNGRPTAEHLVQLVRLALLVESMPLAEMGRAASVVRALVEARDRAVRPLPDPVVETDPVTGLPVIVSPPDAPIHSMSARDAVTMEQSILEEEDLRRAGIPF